MAPSFRMRQPEPTRGFEPRTFRLQELRSDQHTVAHALADTGALHDDLTVAEATDILFTLGSPHTHQLLRRQCGWTHENYRNWLLRTLRHALLDTMC